MSKSIAAGRLKLSLGNLESLPAMPEIARRLLMLPLDTESGEKQMIALVEKDPQISARVIGLANSSAMGSQRQIKGIRDAAMLLGMQRLKSVALGIATMSAMLKQPAGKYFDPHDFWTHSMTIAIVMHAIAGAMPKRIRPDENLIFLAGLLHDIGLAALHHLDYEASEELHHQMCLNPKAPIPEVETELLGVTHAEIGAQLVRHWNLPAEIADVVGSHHSPPTGKEAYANPLIRLVSIAERLLPDFGFAEHTFGPVFDDEWRELCIDSTRVDEIVAIANELALQVVQLPEVQHETVQEVQAHEEALLEAAPKAQDTDLPVTRGRFAALLYAVKRIAASLKFW